ncbi:terminase large subunit [Escherichia coli]
MIPVWSTACPDWAERLKKGLSIIPAPIYPDQAAHALAIFKQLRIVDAPGSPTFGESCAPWVFDLVAALFGSYDAQTGVRHIKEVFILIPKKNSKSTLAAGIMMTALLLNWRQAAGYTILAPTVEVAANAFNPARDMVRRDDDLDDLCQVQTHIRTITHRVTDTTLKVVAADPNTVSGIKSVGTLIDELWLFGKQYKAEDMLREAIGGLASRPEGFVVYTTTQSNEPPAGVFRQKLQYARDVRDGKIHDPHFLPVIFEHPPEMVESGAHLLMENLAMVNPNLGYSVDEAFLYREYRKAREAGEEAFRGFMSKHANVEIGLALRSDRWAGADFWEQQGRRVSLDDILQRADVVTVGIDGGGLDDLLGMYVTGRDRETREWLGWGHAWVHETAVVRRKSEASRFQDFVACGDMTIVRRVGDDTAEVAEYVRRIHEAELLDHIGIDPSGVGQILDSLAEAGIPDESVVGISQGWKLGGAIKTTERKLAEGVLIALVRNALAEAVVARLDTDFVDPKKAAVADVSPASITHDVKGTASTGNPDADAEAAFGQFVAANLQPTGAVWLMSSTNALALSMRKNALGQKEYPDMTLLGGSFQGLPVIVSQYVGDQLVLVNAPDIYLADDGGVAVDMSREASLEMQSEPTGDSTTPSPVELVSMFQTGSVAIRAERWINWRRRRTAAVAVITGVNYGSASGG